MANDIYVSPLSQRYASREMQYIFSPDMKFRTWRKLWIALAETEKELGLPITEEQIEEMKAHADDINYDVAREREKLVRHDVMSHVYAFGVQCPKAKGIIHLGATSCYVGDNTDIILMRDALRLVRVKLVNVIAELAKFARAYRDLPTLGFTHFQPAQPTTVGKRATLWMNEFLLVLNCLGGIAASAMKMATDIRLLQHLKEVEEPFEKNQIGSSAMAYKRNPMRSERICSLARYVMADVLNPAITSGTQWFERTLDDSANKRLSVPEGFLATDGILDLCLNVTDGLKVYPKVIEKRLRSELPFMATENIMMDAVKAGADRQVMHEKIRQLSMEAGRRVKEEGLDNNLLDLIAADPEFHLTREELEKSMDPARYVGCAPHQVDRFLAETVQPILDRYQEDLGVKAEINV